jgi:hypothetical protein
MSIVFLRANTFFCIEGKFNTTRGGKKIMQAGNVPTSLQAPPFLRIYLRPEA